MNPKYLLATVTALFACYTGYSQKVITENGYAVISAEGMPPAQYEVRGASFAPGGRVIRNTPLSNDDANAKVSAKFRVAPDDIDEDGHAANTTVSSWAVAAGWNTAANNLLLDGTPAPTGCPEYQGKEGTDPKGSWRLPTLSEFMLMAIFKDALHKVDGFTPFVATSNTATDGYWTATEYNAATSVDINLYTGVTSNFNKSNPSGNNSNRRVRCISDIP